MKGAREIMRGYIGIDPGSSTGAAAMITENGELVIHDWRDVRSAVDWIEQCRCSFHIQVAAIEAKRVCGPQAGRKAMWMLSQSIGLWSGMLAFAGVEIVYADPQTWQAAFFRRTRVKGVKFDTKQAAIDAVHRFLPKSSEFVFQKKHEHRADALLLAYWVKSRHRGAADRFAQGVSYDEFRRA